MRHTPTVTAFIGAHPWPNNYGNVIVVSNEPFENIYALLLHFVSPIPELVKTIALALKTVYAYEGISTRQHNEPAGNQDVWHYHVHVTPRYTADGFYSSYSSQRALMPSGAGA